MSISTLDRVGNVSTAKIDRFCARSQIFMLAASLLLTQAIADRQN